MSFLRFVGGVAVAPLIVAGAFAVLVAFAFAWAVVGLTLSAIPILGLGALALFVVWAHRI
jgi:hypothetical protein